MEDTGPLDVDMETTTPLSDHKDTIEQCRDDESSIDSRLSDILEDISLDCCLDDIDMEGLDELMSNEEEQETTEGTSRTSETKEPATKDSPRKAPQHTCRIMEHPESL